MCVRESERERDLCVFLGIYTSSQSTQWLDMQATLRVSLGTFLFFAIFALMMIGVKDQKDWRDSVHHGGWIAKLIAWIILVILMFFLPNAVISVYGKVSLFKGKMC